MCGLDNSLSRQRNDDRFLYNTFCFYETNLFIINSSCFPYFPRPVGVKAVWIVRTLHGGKLEQVMIHEWCFSTSSITFWSCNKVKWKYKPVFLLSFESLIAFVLKQSDYSGALDFYEWSESWFENRAHKLSRCTNLELKSHCYLVHEGAAQ